jgi:hypothetical protein
MAILEIPYKRDHVLIFEGRVNGHQIDPDHPAARTHRTRGLLKPAPGPAAEIHHPLTGSQNSVAPLKLGELVDRPRAEALALGALVEMVLAVVAGDGRAT